MIYHSFARSASNADMCSSGMMVCSGALSKTVIAPIETIRMQVMGNKVCCSHAATLMYYLLLHPCVLCMHLNSSAVHRQDLLRIAVLCIP